MASDTLGGRIERQFTPRSIPRSAEVSPARERYVTLSWTAPQAARAEREAQKRAYWRALLERRRADLAAAKQALAQAKCAADRFDARAEVMACEAELLAAQQAYAAVRELG